MNRAEALTVIVAGVNAAVDPHTPGATLKPWGASSSIDIPGYRYTDRMPPWGESLENLSITVSGWIEGGTLADTVAAAIVKELHEDSWRTYRGLYCRLQFVGMRVTAYEMPGTYRVDLDFELETPRSVAYRH